MKFHRLFCSTVLLLGGIIMNAAVIDVTKFGAKNDGSGDNAAALDLRLTAEELGILDKAFPAPDHPTPLDVV